MQNGEEDYSLGFLTMIRVLQAEVTAHWNSLLGKITWFVLSKMDDSSTVDSDVDSGETKPT